MSERCENCGHDVSQHGDRAVAACLQATKLQTPRSSGNYHWTATTTHSCWCPGWK